MTEKDLHSMTSQEAGSGTDDRLAKSEKKTYAKPRLTQYGDLRTMTLAPTYDIDEESGFGLSRRNPGGP